MKKIISNFIIVSLQLLIVGLFFTTVFNKNVKVEKYVSTIHNDNLNKIATSVSLLFSSESVLKTSNIQDDLTVSELPSIDKIEEKVQEAVTVEKEKEVKESTVLYSIDASKYSDWKEHGFEVTEGNKNYSLSDYEFNVVVAVVAGEFDVNLNDALGVVSVILNRCDSSAWKGNSPYDQVIASGQFEVYYTTSYSISYLRYMPNGDLYNSNKYNVAKQAVIDGLNGIRNNKYDGFRANHVNYVSRKTGEDFNNNYIVNNGNKYGYES